MTVRDWTTVDASGRSTPSALNSASMPLEIPRPSTSPITEASRPITRPSSDDRAHDLLARGAERSQRGELAGPLGDRDRQGVEDHERTDEQRDAGEAEQELADHAHSLVELRGIVLRLCGAVLDLQVLRDERLHGVDELRYRRAGLGCDGHAVEAALATEQRLGGLDVPGRDAREAERIDVTERRDSRQLVGARVAARRDLHGVADPVVLLGGGAGVDDDLLGALGPFAGLELERGEARVGGVVADA